MDRINFNQTGGFGLKTQRLGEIQSAYEIFNELGMIAGNLTILSGCELITGSIITDGFVVINNEVLKFKSGYLGESVIIQQIETSKEFENGDVKAVHFERFATFGMAETSWLWFDFVRPLQTKDIPLDLVIRLEKLEKKAEVFQAGGGMLFWGKAANLIPDGWQEVINWRGRIPVGMDVTQTEFNTLGKQGGAKTRTLSGANVQLRPGYNYINTKVNASPTGNGYGGVRGNIIENEQKAVNWSEDNVTPISILNPYRTVLFIEFIE